MIQEFLSPRIDEMIKQWKYYFPLICPKPLDTCLDIGSNTADALILLIQEYPEIQKIIGLEKQSDFCATASNKIKSLNLDNKIQIMNLAVDSLPFDDNTFNITICAETLEWVKSPQKVVQEIQRTLKTGQTTLITHADFDTQVFNIEDKTLGRDVAHGFCDFGPDGQFGRKLYSSCKNAKFSVVEPYIYTIINTDFKENSYSFIVANLMMKWMTQHKTMDTSTLNKWYESLKKASTDGSFYYSINKYICKCTK